MYNKKIIIVTEYFYPITNTTSYYLTNIAKKLSEDNKVEVICNTNLNNLDELKHKNLKIIRIKENRLSKNNILSRTLKFILSSIQLAYVTNKHIKDGEHLFSVTNPAFLIVFLAILRKFKQFNYTLLVYDVFPENLLATNIIKNKSSILFRYLKKVFDWSYSQSDRLVVIGRDMDKVIANKTNNEIPIILIENWCDYKNVVPLEKKDNKILKDLNLLEKKVFLFAGNLGRVQGIKNILKASELVKHKDFILLFIGNGAMKLDILEHIKSSSVKNVFYAGAFPQSEQNLFLNACDIALVSLGNSMYGLGVPSKSYFNMASAKPLLFIGDRESEIAKVIVENNIGWVVESEDDLALASKFDEICENFDKVEGYGIKAREVVKTKYSQDVILEKYKKLYL